MSVVIKGMELPDGCLNCKLFNGTGCMATMTMFPKWMNVAARPKDCPMSDCTEDAISSEPSISMAKIINAISRSMTCDICPYPCKAKGKSSMANCNSHWIEILSNMEIKDREEVRDQVFKLFYKDSFNFN